MTTATASLNRPAAAQPMQSTIRIYNTLSKTKEPFQTVQPGKVGMYLCGPTVYAEAHIGHMVGPVIFDTIKRYLVFCGYDVTWVVNITDVDDKLIASSLKRGISMFQVATEMTADYLSNLQQLGVDQIDHMPRATENMDEIIRFISELIQKGHAYVSEGDVYFDVTSDTEYGQLSNRSADSQQGDGGGTSARKQNPGDFALWKTAKEGEPSWDSPWGKGRPGWHIECSAMSRRILGKTFDIHGGGLDLLFPHHENELAQSRCCHDQQMVRYWMHNGLMRASSSTGKVGGKSDRDEPAPADAVSGKISRSKGGGGLAKLIEDQTGERLRFFLLRSHYRSTTVFGDEPLAEAGTALEAFYRLFERYQQITTSSVYDLAINTKRSSYSAPKSSASIVNEIVALRTAFLSKMDDDFNTGGAVSDLFEMARCLNRLIDAEKLEENPSNAEGKEALQQGMAILRELSAILGLFKKPPRKQNDAEGATKTVDDLMQLIIKLRAEARAKKDFAAADLIRDGLANLKIQLLDKKGTTVWEQSK
jgi:cysteinyl-tRNA synthetase